MADLVSLMWLPAAACLVLVTIHAYLGMHVLARGVIFVDLALAQIAAFGATVALLMGYDLHSPQAWALSLVATFAGAAVFALSRIRYREVPQEAIIGVTYAVASSAAILVVDQAPHGAEHIKALLVGSILWVTPAQVIKAALIYAVVGLFHWRFRDRFLLITHVGRTSANTYRTPLEVVVHDTATGEYIVCSGTGRDADWYRNISATPVTSVQVRNRVWAPEQVMLTDEEAGTRFAEYERAHPKTAARLLDSMGRSYDGTDEDRVRMMAGIPMVSFSDSPRPSAS